MRCSLDSLTQRITAQRRKTGRRTKVKKVVIVGSGVDDELIIHHDTPPVNPLRQDCNYSLHFGFRGKFKPVTEQFTFIARWTFLNAIRDCPSRKSQEATGFSNGTK